MSRSAVPLVVAGRGSNGSFFPQNRLEFRVLFALALTLNFRWFSPHMVSRCQHPPTPTPTPPSCCRLHAFASFTRSPCCSPRSFPSPPWLLSPPHAKPFLRKLVFMRVRTERQILAEQLKTQYWRGENVCQAENRACWLVFQVQVKTGPLNPTRPRRVCSLPTPVNL